MASSLTQRPAGRLCDGRRHDVPDRDSRGLGYGEFQESQIGRMRPGDRVDIEIDAYSGYNLSGYVQSIQYGSGSRFSAFPAENATGNSSRSCSAFR